MERILFLIIFSYCFIKVVENIVSWVNLGHLKVYGDRLPPGFADYVDKKTLTSMRDYTMAGTRLSFCTSAFDTIVTLVFIFGGLLDCYNSWFASLAIGPVSQGIVFFLLITYGQFILNIPFDLYSTFVLEERFGFNRQSLKLWLIDAIKGLLLTTIVSGLLLGAVFWLIMVMPRHWWFLVWLLLLFFKLFMLYISPYVIEPLFNRFSPIEDQDLEKKIKEMLARAGLTVSRVFTMDASRRSGHGNAYFSGIGHVKRIVLFDTLLANINDDEVLAILAHEAGHWKLKHIVRRLFVMEMASFVGLYGVWWLVQDEWLINIFAMSHATLPLKLFLVAFLGSLVFFPLRPLSSWLSRRHEWQADDYAVKLSGQPRALARALVKLGRDNLANLHPHPWNVIFNYSHPPLAQRVGRLLKQAGD